MLRCVLAREAGVEGESWRALVMGTAETEVARSWGAGEQGRWGGISADTGQVQLPVTTPGL